MVNLLDYRSNSDYDAVAQVGKIHIVGTIPRGTYSNRTYYKRVSVPAPSGFYFVNQLYRSSISSGYIPAAFFGQNIPGATSSQGGTPVLNATYEQSGANFVLVLHLVDSYSTAGTITIPQDITVDLWINISKMPF